MTDPAPIGVHLNGSIPLATAEEVFRLAVGVLGPRIRRVPDGETGPRSNWIEWQLPVLQRQPSLETVPPDPEHYRPLPRVQFRPGTSALHLGGLGYAEAARASWLVFSRLQASGELPAGLRFQVCLPTPLAPMAIFVMAHDQAAIEERYEQRMLEELREIVDAIPHHRLSIQWDTAVEFALLEGVFPAWFADVRDQIVERLLRLGNAVPPDVELGYHLCYGDAGHRHFVEPSDTSNLVDVAMAVARGLERPLAWIHMPVPRSRDDPEYFRPLRDLHLADTTELYLGLVHRTDGFNGARRRAAAAAEFVPNFGVATECGMGRRPPETVPDLLRLHAELAVPR
jgi:hypothetical protein